MRNRIRVERAVGVVVVAAVAVQGQTARAGSPNVQQESREPSETFVIEAGSEAESFAAPIETRPEPRRPAYTQQLPAPNQPIFLPGESLSKYGHAPAAEPMIEIEAMPSNPIEPARPTPAYTTFKPSTLVETPIVWDGSSLLPGETISRYRNEPPVRAAQAVVHEQVSEVVPVEHAEPAAEVQTEEAKAEEVVVENAIEAEAEAAVEETTSHHRPRRRAHH